MTWIVEFGPLLLLTLFFVFLIWQLRRGRADSLVEQRRHNEVLEKLLAQHDARLRKLGVRPLGSGDPNFKLTHYHKRSDEISN